MFTRLSFFSQHVMYESIKNYLNRPDVVKQYGKRFELIKRFTYDIGLIGYTDQTSKSVKVVYTKTRRTVFVITAYPIASWNKCTWTCLDRCVQKQILLPTNQRRDLKIVSQSDSWIFNQWEISLAFIRQWYPGSSHKCSDTRTENMSNFRCRVSLGNDR